MKAYPYEYARQIWICTIMSRKTNNEECEENGRCDGCELADEEKTKETKILLEGIPKLEAEHGTHTLEAAKNQIKKLIEEVDKISVDPTAYQVLSTMNIKEKLEKTLQILEAEGA